MILRNAQLLLHQVNMLPAGGKGNVMPALVPPVDAVMTQVATPTPVPTPTVKKEIKEEESKPVGIDDSNVAKVAANRDDLPEENSEEPKERFTLLMVDDSPDMCRFVHDYFRGEYTVITASNGEVALERLEENDNVDLVVSDVNMPKMDGLELCKRIKTDLRWSHIPVILLTGRRGDQLEMEGLRLGADDYITKPFNVEMLRLRVKKFIEKRENRQRQFREKMDVAPNEITITSVDEQFIQRAIKICEDHMSDTEFSVEVLGQELSLSRTYLYKKLINITGKGPAEFIRTIRLKRGKQYLEQTTMPIADISLEIGYGNPKRFTENFKAEYGMSPSEYGKKVRAEKSVK
jgi:YesN/AraC family two-component response regulator